MEKFIGCIPRYLADLRADLRERSERSERGLIFGLSVGLNRDGSAVIKHYALRLTLWLKGYTQVYQFLNHCARLILLKKVGGGYIFIHSNPGAPLAAG